jgi:hypothetical protein
MDYSRIFKYFLYVFWPFAGVVYSIRERNFSAGLFSIFVFSTFFAVNIYNRDLTDIYGYVTESSIYADTSLMEIFAQKDFFYPLVSKIVNFFGSNYYFIIICFSAIYHFFFYKLITFATKGLQNRERNFYSILFVVALYCSYPFIHFIAFRFTTAVLYFSWCMLEYVINRRRVHLLLLLLTPLIHFSFFIMLFLVPIFFWLGKAKRGLEFAILFFVASLIFSNTSLATNINNFTKEYFSESISGQLVHYASEEGIEKNVERYSLAAANGSIKRAINRGITAYVRYVLMYSCVFFVLYRWRFLKSNQVAASLYFVSLTAFSLANFASSVYHGDRFYSLGMVIYFISVVYIFISNRVDLGYRIAFYTRNVRYLYFLMFLVMLNFSNSVYMNHETINLPNLFFGNWFTAFTFNT